MIDRFASAFNRFHYADAEAVWKRYPQYWNAGITGTRLYQQLLPVLTPATNVYDIVPMLNYYKGEALSKDTKKIFNVVTRETVERHGYGPDQGMYLATWYFIIVLLAEYDAKRTIQPTTDIKGMYQCYLDTGEIDYEHSW